MESNFEKKFSNENKKSIYECSYFAFREFENEFINSINEEDILKRDSIIQLENKLKEYIIDQSNVLQYGNDYESFEEELFTGCLVNSESNSPVNGLVYERNEDMIYWYCNYKDGYKNGLLVEFYDNNKIKSIESIFCNMLEGVYLKLNKEQEIIELGKCHVGVKLKYYKFNKQKNIIESKKDITRAESIIIKTREKAMVKK